MKLSLLILLFSASLYSQINLLSPENIRRFADYLYCEKDYLRAAEEYEKYYTSTANDTVQFKIALAYTNTGDLVKASEKMSSISSGSPFYLKSREELAKISFLKSEPVVEDSSLNSTSISKLKALSDLMMKDHLPSVSELSSSFKGDEKRTVLEFYRRKENAPYKSEIASGVLSALIPGAGKIYTGNYSDGIVSFLVTTVMGYIAYTDFKAEHNFRGYLFSGLTAFFYAGNVYGSVANAQLYNSEIKYNYNQDLNEFVEKENYFMKDYEFCK